MLCPQVEAEHERAGRHPRRPCCGSGPGARCGSIRARDDAPHEDGHGRFGLTRFIEDLRRPGTVMTGAEFVAIAHADERSDALLDALAGAQARGE